MLQVLLWLLTHLPTLMNTEGLTSHPLGLKWNFLISFELICGYLSYLPYNGQIKA